MLFLISFYPWVNICFIMNRLIAHGFSNAKELRKFLLTVDIHFVSLGCADDSDGQKLWMSGKKKNISS